MTNCSAFQTHAGALREFINEAVGSPARVDVRAAAPLDRRFNNLALALFALQFEHNPAYREFCRAKNVTPQTVARWSEVPVMPALAFKELDLSSLPGSERTTVFHSSGTTGHHASRHFHSADSLALYEASLWPWFQKHLLPEWNQTPPDAPRAGTDALRRLGVLCLTPPRSNSPNSSLVHMFDTVRREFGGHDFHFAGTVVAGGAWELDFDAALEALENAARLRRPLMLLGTAFSFVHLLDGLAEHRRPFDLPAGSRALETGGYKGRSRSLSKPALHTLITEHLGIPPSGIVCEYGMSELSSQAYDGVAGGKPESLIGHWPSVIRPQISATADCQSPIANPESEIPNPQSTVRDRVFRFPPWVRAQVISPETNREVNEGETGLIRILDLANAWSVMAVQTEDLGVRRGGGFELIGRAALAESRGCSLMAKT